MVLTSGEEETTPFAMFWYGSFHGGIWNCPYTLESVSGTVGYVLGKAYEYYHYYAAAGTVVAETAAAGPRDDDDRSPPTDESRARREGGKETTTKEDDDL